MFTEVLQTAKLVLPLTLFTVIVEAAMMLRGPKTAGSSTAGSIFGILCFCLILGWMAVVVYHWIVRLCPANPAGAYLLLAAAAAVALTVLAVGMPIFFHSPWNRVMMWTLQNIVWAGVYGVYLPKILSAIVTP